MMRSIWWLIASIFGLTTSKLISIYSKVSSSHTESFTSSAFVYPVFLFSFDLMIFDTPSMSTAYSDSLFYSKAACLFLYLSNSWLHRRNLHFTASSATVMSVGSGVFGSYICFNRWPTSFPKSQLMVTWFWTFSKNSSYSFLMPPYSGALKVLSFLTKADFDPSVFGFVDEYSTLIFRINFSWLSLVCQLREVQFCFRV